MCAAATCRPTTTSRVSASASDPWVSVTATRRLSGDCAGKFGAQVVDAGSRRRLCSPLRCQILRYMTALIVVAAGTAPIIPPRRTADFAGGARPTAGGLLGTVVAYMALPAADVLTPGMPARSILRLAILALTRHFALITPLIPLAFDGGRVALGNSGESSTRWPSNFPWIASHSQPQSRSGRAGAPSEHCARAKSR